MAAAREPNEVEAALLRRAQEAVDAAARIRAHSEVLVVASAVLRESGMASRCAWCGRFRFAERWVVVALPVFAERVEVTHGICEDCVGALRAAGMSV